MQQIMDSTSSEDNHHVEYMVNKEVKWNREERPDVEEEKTWEQVGFKVYTPSRPYLKLLQ